MESDILDCGKNIQVKEEEPGIMSVKAEETTNSSLDEVNEHEEQETYVSQANSEESEVLIPSLADLPSNKTPAKSIRRELNLQEKVELINESDNQSQRKLAKKFQISKSQVGSILKRKAQYLDYYQKNQSNPARKRMCLRDIDSIRHRLDNLLTDWIEEALSKKIQLSGPLLRKKALEFAEEIGYTDFKASNGWLDSFKARNNVVFQKPSRGSSSSTPKPIKTELSKSFQNRSNGRKEAIKQVISEENVGPLISDIVLSHSEEERPIPIPNMTETTSKIHAEVPVEGGSNLLNNYMKYCDDGATKRLEETIRTDLTEAEQGLKELIALSKDSDFKLKTVINQKQEKSELLQQKLQDVANLQCEINLLATEEEHLTTSNSQILGKISTVEEKVKSCGQALDDIQVIQEQQKSYTTLYNMVTNNSQFGVPPNT